jgi:RNA polymerase sigma-70 factor (ECF subfamily)
MDWVQLQTCDETVYRNLAADDYRGALEALVRGYQHVIVGFCTNMLDDASLGEEMAQEVFLAVYRAMPRFRGHASVRTWLFAIARKQCLQAIRNRRRRSYFEHTQRDTIAATAHRDPPLPPGEDPELQLQRVKHSLSKLNKAERALLIMRYDTGLPFIDIAHILGISVASVRRRLARALQHLREVMPHDA